MTPDRFARRIVKLTDAEVAEIERRKGNAIATRQIVGLRDGLKAVKFGIHLLKAAEPQQNTLAWPGMNYAIKLLGAERDRLQGLIKGLEEGKQPKPEAVPK